MPVLEEAIAAAGCKEIEGIVLTHAHPDHIGGVNQVRGHFGDMPVYKMPWPTDAGISGPGGDVSPIAISNPDTLADGKLEKIQDGDVVETEGASLRAIFTPGHAPDHLCYVLEEENNLFSGDNVLGIGTTVIPATSGDLGDYMNSLERVLAESPTSIYPAHGPKIEAGTEKIQQYIEHRLARERQVLEALTAGDRDIMSMVKRIYIGYPENLHSAAGQSVTSHLTKLEREGIVRSDQGENGGTLWELT
jgi:glyoxylase-like metal-dependent hydrolase (beta-lactamase superfamily II)